MSEVKPQALRIDVSTHCQLNCPACPNGRRELRHTDVGVGFLRIEEFKRIIDENPWVARIALSNWGEPFLHPQMLELLEYAHRKGVGLSALTNLNSIKDDVIEGLVKYRFEQLVISLDGATEEAYQVYRVGGNFNNVLENVEKINRMKRKYKSRYPSLIWQFLVFGHNEHEIATARKMAEELDMDFGLGMPINMDFTTASCDCEFSPIKDKSLVRKELGYATLEELKEAQGVFRDYGVCLQLWDEPAINWDGTVLGCCVTTRALGGNAFREGLMRSVNSDTMRYARQMVTGKVPPREDVPCSQCIIYRLMKQDGTWAKRGIVHRGFNLFQRELPGTFLALRSVYLKLNCKS